MADLPDSVTFRLQEDDDYCVVCGENNARDFVDLADGSRIRYWRTYVFNLNPFLGTPICTTCVIKMHEISVRQEAPPDTERSEPRRKDPSMTLRMQVLYRDGFQCLSCHTPENLAIDHIKPASQGGGCTLDNLQTLCKSCNSKKRTKTIDYRIKQAA